VLLLRRYCLRPGDVAASGAIIVPSSTAVLWKLRTGVPWRDRPEHYAPWQTCADRLYRWRRDRTSDRIWAHVQTRSDAVGEIIWDVSVDSTTARRHAPTSMPVARGVGRVRPTHKGVQHPPDERLGRSRGGLTIKFRLACWWEGTAAHGGDYPWTPP
jgi:transposase